MSLADQMAETTPHPELELRFLKSMSLADQKVETTAKAAESVLHQGGDISQNLQKKLFSAKADTCPI